jgi:molybdate/tungstate transport system substrate-binding protein
MQADGNKTILRVVAAGSLLIPFEETERTFEQAHPGVDVQVEGHGSIQAIRQVTDLHRQVDVVAVADESLIPDLMYRQIEGEHINYSDGYTPFATNSMVIVYTNQSRYAGEINRTNWYEILSRPDVRVGFANPMLDASGYRALMVTLLAEEYSGNRAILATIVGNHFDPPLVPSRTGNLTTVTLPEIMRPSDNKLAIRDGSIYLISLLEAGGVDYAFEYRNVAEALNLSWVDLPPAIDLSSPDYAGDYARVRVILGFQRFSTVGRERTGEPIVYAITIPNNAPNPGLAKEFVELVLSESRTGGRGWPAPLSRAGS